MAISFTPREINQIHARRLKWIEALLSGEFKQGKAYLRTAEGKYCCLGVANRVCRLNQDGNLKLGLDNRCKLGLSGEQQSRLVHLNDHSRKSFRYIAGVITRMPIKRDE